MLDSNDPEIILREYNIEQVRFLLGRFKDVEKNHRLNAIKAAVKIALDRYEKEKNEPVVLIFKRLQDIVDSVRSIKQLELIIENKDKT